MTKSLRIFTPFVLLGFLFLSLWGLSRSVWFMQHPSSLSLGIILDFAITIPLVYFFCIRNTKVPNLSVVPVFILGLVASSFIIPVEHQGVLDSLMTWVLPVVELSVFSILILKIRKLVRTFKETKSQESDFFTALQQAAQDILPGFVGKAFATEISGFYYGFLHWKKIKLAQNHFSYHKKSGTVALLAAVIFIVLVETTVLHLVLSRWSVVVAWVLSGLSIYTAFQLFAFLRSLSKRPYILDGTKLFLRYGILSEAVLDIRDIERIELSRKTLPADKSIRKLSPLGELDAHNVLLFLKEERTLQGLYGQAKNYQNLAIYVDQPEAFKKMLEENC